MTDNESLTWTISRTEKRDRNQKILIQALFGFPIVIFLMSLGVSEVSDFAEYRWGAFTYSILAIIGTLITLLFVNRFFPYRERYYFADNNGITVSRGYKTKTYAWDDFVCFYAHTEDHKNARAQGLPNTSRRSAEELAVGDLLKGSEKEEGLTGHKFYLRKRPLTLWSQFYKVLVVVYSEPDNITAVRDFLAKHLPRKHAGTNIDLGLTMYRFK